MYTFNPGNSFYEYNSNPQGPFTNAQFIACQNPQATGTSRLSGAAYLGSCINPVAMMYLGTPDSFTQTNFTPIVDMHYKTIAGFVNDQWKLHAKKLHEITFMLGARIEHLGPWTDKHNNGLATFSPTLYKQACTQTIGAPVSCAQTSDYPGIVWHGVQSSIPNSVNNPQSVYFSPRVGLAWDILGHGNTVLHGGWGVYRHQEEFAPYAAAASTAQGYKTTYLQQQWNFDGVDAQSPINPSDFNINVLSTTDTDRPVIYQYNGTISQRITTTRLKNAFANSLVEVAYVGTSMQHLSSYNTQGGNYSEASDLNLIPSGYMFGDQSSNGFCLCNLPANLSAVSIGALTTAGQDYFRPYPFYQHVYMLNHRFYGNYNGLQASWNKSAGLVSFGMNYTFSKVLATAASYNNQIVDPVNLRNDYNPTPYDRTNVFNAHYQIDLGKRYKGDNSLLKQVANGWQVSGIELFQSGIDIPSGQGENFGFGYGSLQVQQVYTVQQATSTSITPVCVQQYNIPPDKNGHRYLRHEHESDGMAGNAGLSVDADAQLQSGWRKQAGSSVHQSDMLRRAAAGQPHDRAERTVGQSQRAGRVPAALYSRTGIPATQSHGDQKLRGWGSENLPASRGCVQLPQSPAGLVQQQRQHEPEHGQPELCSRGATAYAHAAALSELRRGEHQVRVTAYRVRGEVYVLSDCFAAAPCLRPQLREARGPGAGID